ncbi:MAG: peroxidase-related enzyme [Balneolaceae bacterium]
MAPFINVIDFENAEGELKNIYENIIRKRGKLAEVHKIQSLNPESIIRHMDLYMTIMFGKSPLKRSQREMMAVVVSAINDCEYCRLHHGEALHRYWKNEENVLQLGRDYRKLELKTNDLLLCDLAERVTRLPADSDFEESTQALKKGGMTDRAILDAVLVISYFNFVNRLVIGLGVEPSPDEIKGYKY